MTVSVSDELKKERDARNGSIESRPTSKTLLPFKVIKAGGVLGLEYEEVAYIPASPTDDGRRTIPMTYWCKEGGDNGLMKPILRLMEMYAELERTIDGHIARETRMETELVQLRAEVKRQEADLKRYSTRQSKREGS